MRCTYNRVGSGSEICGTLALLCFDLRRAWFKVAVTMALGILEPKTASEQPPGTELLVDNAQTGGEHQLEHENFKHGKGKVLVFLKLTSSRAHQHA